MAHIGIKLQKNAKFSGASFRTPLGGLQPPNPPVLFLKLASQIYIFTDDALISTTYLG